MPCIVLHSFARTECPVCGTPANHYSRICAHSYACSDFVRTQSPSGHRYILGIQVNRKELMRSAANTDYPEDDYI